MGPSGALLLLGDLHFIEPEWAGLAKVPSVTTLKVRCSPFSRTESKHLTA